MRGCERRWGPPLTIAQSLQRRIGDELGLPASLGVASNKLVAKIASDAAKPAGIRLVQVGGEVAFLAPLPVQRLPGVGPATAARLTRLGIATVGQLAGLSQATLVREFGEAAGASLYEKSRGHGPATVDPEHRPKNISHETTFARDLSSRDAVERHVLEQAEAVAARLRAHRFQARTVTLKLRFADFQTITRSQTLGVPTDLATTIYAAARSLLAGAWKRGHAVRLVGVGASNLVDRVGYQLDLFSESPATREARLSQTLDELRARFGEDVIKRARLLDEDD